MATVRELITKIVFKTDKNSIKTAEKSIDNVKKQLENMGKVANASGASTNAIFQNVMTNGRNAGNAIKTAMDGARRSIDSMRSSALQASGALNTVRASGRNVPIVKQSAEPKPGKLEKAGSFATAGVAAAATGAAIVAPLANAVEDAKNFEYAMSKVQAVTQASAEDMSKLTAQARELGRATEFNATQVAEAQKYLGLAGWKTNAILATTPTLLQLAIAGGTDLARTADIISDGMTAMGISVDNSGKSVMHFADIFAATMSNSNTTIEMMGEGMKYAGTIAGTMGYKMEDVALAIGLMANSGVKASEAGTALRAVMTRLSAPPKEAAEAFAQLEAETGISVSSIDKLTGKVKPLREVFIQLRKALQKYNEAERVAFGKQIAGMYGTAGLNAIVKATDEDFNRLMNSIDNADGASEKMSKTMQDNLRGSLIATKSAAYDLNVELGKSLTPTLREGSGMLTGFLNGLTDLSKEFPRLTSAVAVFGGIVGGLLVGLGALGIAVGGIVTLAGALGVTVSAPIVAGILAIIAIVSAVIANLDKLKAKFKEIKEWIKGFNIGSVFNSFKERLKERTLSLDAGIEGVDDSALQNIDFSSLVDKANSQFGDIRSVVSETFDGIKEKVGSVISGIVSEIGKRINNVGEKLNGLKPIASVVLGFIKGLLDALINPLDSICSLLDRASRGFAGLISNAEKGASQQYTNIVQKTNQTNNITVSSAKEAGSFVQEAYPRDFSYAD